MDLKKCRTLWFLISLFIFSNQYAFTQEVLNKNIFPINFNPISAANRIISSNSYYQTAKYQSKEFYLNKSKNQKTAAWILLGAGTAFAVVGVIGFESTWDDSDSDSYSTTDIFGFVLTAGIISDLVSIPFFISSHHNKKHASSLSFGTQSLTSRSIKSMCQSIYPSLTLKFNL
jgi:hypothetical protein